MKTKKFSALRGLMAAKGISQRDLTKMTGLCLSEISLKLCGKRRFTLRDVGLIAAALEIPPELFAVYFPTDNEMED